MRLMYTVLKVLLNVMNSIKSIGEKDSDIFNEYIVGTTWETIDI